MSFGCCLVMYLGYQNIIILIIIPGFLPFHLFIGVLNFITQLWNFFKWL